MVEFVTFVQSAEWHDPCQTGGNALERHRTKLGRNHEQGVIITLVAVFMLFVVGAMAALSIDVVTMYTARSEAQLAADAGALAGARVLANSGGTSDPTGAVLASAVSFGSPAQTIAIHVAEQNKVGGIKPTVTVTFGGTNLPSNPTVTVKVQVPNLPTFFARIWGRTTYTVGASAIAEVYNPSYGTKIPVAPICVKPWLLPNISPTAAGGQIFNPATGAIVDTTLLGWETPGGSRLRTKCSTPSGGTSDCLPASANTPAAWRYYPGTTDPTDPTSSFPAPTSCNGCTGFSPYQLSIAGCVQTPISCYSSAPPAPAPPPPVQVINIDTNPNPNRDADTGTAVDGLTHATAADWGDSVDPADPPSPPFQFVAGLGNRIPGLAGNTTPMMVSDSLVTVPVIDTSTWPPVSYPQVQVIGFVQLFLNYLGDPVPPNNHIRTKVINLVGCGTNATGTPISGNGASPMAVRLIWQ